MTDFLTRRKKGIGGSDASCILGTNPWKNALAVYLDKTNQNIIEETENQFTHFGKILEQVVADEFTRVTGKKVQKNNKLLVHEKYEFIIGNIDRKVIGENAFLECKTTSAFNSTEWEQGVPEYYYAQVQHYLAILNYDKCYVACLIGGNKFVYHTVERNETYIENLIQKEIEFWNENVLKLTPPEIDSHEFTKDYLNKRFSSTVANPKEITTDITATLSELQTVKVLEKDLKQRKDLLENRVRDFMEDNETAEGEKFKISYKFQTTKKFNSTEFKKNEPNLYEQYINENTTRVLRVTEVKQK